MKQFYAELVEIESIVSELDKIEVSKEEKLHLAKLIDSSLHHVILDIILSQLPKADRRVFIDYLKEDNHIKIWKFLNEKIDGVEKKIKNAAEDLKIEFHKDLKNAKKL